MREVYTVLFEKYKSRKSSLKHIKEEYKEVYESIAGLI